MITIYKYPFILGNNIKFSVPGFISILKVDVQNVMSGQLCLWAIIDTEASNTKEVNLRIVGTGHDFPDYNSEKFHFLNTILDAGFVWHVFQIIS